jgi:hypothetical protein
MKKVPRQITPAIKILAFHPQQWFNRSTMPAKKPYSAPPKVDRGRRTSAEKEARRWRLSIKEATETKDGYSWTTYIVQGWQEGSRWQRKRFKSRAEAEAFKASKQLEFLPDADPIRLVPTGLNQEQVREAELAFTRLEALDAMRGHDGAIVKPSLLAAVDHYLAHLRTLHAVERVPMLQALAACLADKEARGVLRHRSALQLKSSVKLFTAWLVRLDRYTAESINPAWSPAVADVTTADVVAYLASLRSKAGLTAAPKTVNNSRADLRGFFAWCTGQERDTPLAGCARRWHTSNPAADTPKKSVPTGSPHILSVEQSTALMVRLEKEWPAYLPFFALALFAGIRPGENGELHKMAKHENLHTPSKEAGGRPLIDLDRLVVTIPPTIAKTGKKRVVPISGNLAAWLAVHPGPILPVGFQAGLETIRKTCQLSHDVLRHSFISYRVTASGSKAKTALEAGNSEGVIDKHYLNLPSEAEATAFWQIMPSGKA